VAPFSLCGLHAIRANWFENERELAGVVARFTVNSEARDKSLIGTVSELLLTVDGQEDAVQAGVPEPSAFHRPLSRQATTAAAIPVRAVAFEPSPDERRREDDYR
jgi:hypothetical protein